MAGLISFPRRKHDKNLRRLHIYIHENAQILQFRNFNLDASWSTDRPLTEREIFTSFLLDVSTFPRWNIVTLLRIYIKEGKIKIQQHLFGPKSQNTIIDSERKCLFCRVEGEEPHWRLYRLPAGTVYHCSDKPPSRRALAPQ